MVVKGNSSLPSELSIKAGKVFLPKSWEEQLRKIDSVKSKILHFWFWTVALHKGVSKKDFKYCMTVVNCRNKK